MVWLFTVDPSLLRVLQLLRTDNLGCLAWRRQVQSKGESRRGLLICYFA